jgi:hypothetical protein
MSVAVSQLTLPKWVPTPSRIARFLWASNVAIMAGGLPDIVISFQGGLGDDILCGIVARELRNRGVRRVWQLTNFADLYSADPDFIALHPDLRLLRFCGILGKRCLELSYPHPPPMHLAATMCEAAGIRGHIEVHPKIFLSEKEKLAGKVTLRRQIAIQTSSLGARWPMRNKQWPPERFQTVTNALKNDFDLVQLGALTDPKLSDALDLRGKTTVRQAAAILAASHVFVGLVGGLMHMARAVECRSVIVYGGREHPLQSGYSANENLYWHGPCAPCWRRDDCDFDRICLDEISSDSVIVAARKQAELYGKALPVDRLTI